MYSPYILSEEVCEGLGYIFDHNMIEVNGSTSLVPRSYEGEERAWYTLLAHAPGAPEKCGAPDTIVYLVYDAYSVYTLC